MCVCVVVVFLFLFLLFTWCALFVFWRRVNDCDSPEHFEVLAAHYIVVRYVCPVRNLVLNFSVYWTLDCLLMHCGQLINQIHGCLTLEANELAPAKFLWTYIPPLASAPSLDAVLDKTEGAPHSEAEGQVTSTTELAEDEVKVVKKVNFVVVLFFVFVCFLFLFFTFQVLLFPEKL